MVKTAIYDQYPPLDTIFALLHEERDVAFLDSSLQNELGQFSILARKPYLKLVQGATFTVNGVPCETPFDDYVRQYLHAHKAESVFPDLPLTAGAIGYFSYDYGRKQEGVASHCEKTVSVPDAVLCFYDQFLIEDHRNHRLYLISHDHLQNAEDGLEALRQLVSQAGETTLTAPTSKVAGQNHASSNFTQEDYLAAVERMIDYIIEGDVYIANLTQQLQIHSNVSPYDLFCRLRKENPSPFGGFLQCGDFQIVSSSPERFLQMRNRFVQTRPIKGTRKRGETPEEDDLLRQELQQSEKDRSELLMIVDLERNDLNRVCVPGSVQVDSLFSVESYATVFHLVANVTGTLQPEYNSMDLITSAFPGGSITGAPKLRAMEIIDELEHSRRNIYTGSMGYFSLSGDCDWNILIRTALFQDGCYHIGVGGGITCESDPAFEYEETLQKAKALLRALDTTFEPTQQEATS